MRTVILRRGLVALFAAAVSFGAIVQAQAAETLRIGYQKYGTLVLLKAKGTLEKRLAAQGVNVQWTEFPGGPQLLEGLNVGSIDFGVTGETPPVFAQAAGADLLYVAYEPPAPTSEAILVPKDSPIKSVAELKGKKVVLNKGSNVHYLLVRALEDAGLKYTAGRGLPAFSQCRADIGQVQPSGKVLAMGKDHRYPGLAARLEFAISQAQLVEQLEIKGVALGDSVQADQKQMTTLFTADATAAGLIHGHILGGEGASRTDGTSLKDEPFKLRGQRGRAFAK